MRELVSKAKRLIRSMMKKEDGSWNFLLYLLDGELANIESTIISEGRLLIDYEVLCSAIYITNRIMAFLKSYAPKELLDSVAEIIDLANTYRKRLMENIEKIICLRRE